MLLFRLVIGFRISQVIFQQQGVRNHVKGINAINSSKNFDRSTITAVEAVAGRPMNALLPRTLDRGQMLSSLFITINLELLDKLLVFVMHLQKQSMALHTGHLKESLHEMLFKSIDNKILIGKVLDEPRIQAGVESIPGCIPQFCLVIGFDLP